MKVFFDTNVYIAEALIGGAAERMVAATITVRWRIYTSTHILSELKRVMRRLGFPSRFTGITQGRVRRRSKLVIPPASRHTAPLDPEDGPVLRAALACGADFLVTNDRHLLVLNPYEGLRIVSMVRYFNILEREGLL